TRAVSGTTVTVDPFIDLFDSQVYIGTNANPADPVAPLTDQTTTSPLLKSPNPLYDDTATNNQMPNGATVGIPGGPTAMPYGPAVFDTWSQAAAITYSGSNVYDYASSWSPALATK